jgi:hypothetical protein
MYSIYDDTETEKIPKLKLPTQRDDCMFK